MTHGTSGRGGSWFRRCEAALVSIYKVMIGSLKEISHLYMFTRKAPLLVAGLNLEGQILSVLLVAMSLPLSPE